VTYAHVSRRSGGGLLAPGSKPDDAVRWLKSTSSTPAQRKAKSSLRCCADGRNVGLVSAKRRATEMASAYARALR